MVPPPVIINPSTVSNVIQPWPAYSETSVTAFKFPTTWKIGLGFLHGPWNMVSASVKSPAGTKTLAFPLKSQAALHALTKAWYERQKHYGK